MMLGTTKTYLWIVCLVMVLAGIVGGQAATATPPAVGATLLPAPQVVLPVPHVPLPPGWAPKQMQLQIPILVPEGFPVGPPPWILKRLPLIPPVLVPSLLGAKRAPVDPGSLKTDSRLVPDGKGGHYLVEERTWTSQGVPCREIIETHTLENLPRPAATPNLPKTDEQPQTLPQPVPDSNEQPQALPQPVPDTTVPPAPKPAALEPAEPAIEEPAEDAPASKLNLVEVEPASAAPAEEPRQAMVRVEEPSGPVRERGAMVGVGVSVDSAQGTRVYEYYQGEAGPSPGKGIERRIESRVQSVPGAGTGIGIGVSVDPKHGTRVYRYQHGNSTSGGIVSQ